MTSKHYGVLPEPGVGGDTEAPTIPQSLVATPFSAVAMDLTWDASTDNVGVTGYQVFQDDVPVLSVTGTTARVENLSPGTTYTFEVSAFDAAGNNSQKSNSALGTTNSNSAPVWSYTNQSLTNGVAYSQDLNLVCTDADGDDLTFTVVTGTLPAGLNLSGDVISGTPTTDEVQVVTLRADDLIVTTDTTVTFTVTSGDTTPPPVPGSENIFGITTSSMTYNWGTVEPFSDDDLASYRVYRSTDGVNYGLRATVTELETNPPSSLIKSEFTDTGLSAGTEYFWRATSVDDSGNESAQSTGVSAFTTTFGNNWAAQGSVGYTPAIRNRNPSGATVSPGRGYGMPTRHAYTATSTPTIVHVTNLNNSGSGSFRDAISQPNRIVVFDVAGVINLTSSLRLDFHTGNIWIAGQTAPGLVFIQSPSEDAFVIDGSNVFMQHVAIWQSNPGGHGTEATAMAITSYPDTRVNCVVDHCWFANGVDNNLEMGQGPTEFTDVIDCVIGPGATAGLNPNISAKGTIIGDNSTKTNYALIGNFMPHLGARAQLWSCGQGYEAHTMLYNGLNNNKPMQHVVYLSSGAMSINNVNCIHWRGTDTLVSQRYMEIDALVAGAPGSQSYVSGCRAIGTWTGFSNPNAVGDGIRDNSGGSWSLSGSPLSPPSGIVNVDIGTLSAGDLHDLHTRNVGPRPSNRATENPTLQSIIDSMDTSNPDASTGSILSNWDSVVTKPSFSSSTFVPVSNPHGAGTDPNRTRIEEQLLDLAEGFLV